MGILSGTELRRRLVRDRDEGTEGRLVVTPLLDPDEQVRVGQSAIDLRLGFTFALVSPSTQGAIDEFVGSERENYANIAGHFRHVYVPFGRRLVIHPHQFILASTLEYIRLPGDLAAQVLGRSTWGRLGLVIATAFGIHPGFAGTLTLEMRNLGETPLVLYPGQTVAQLFLHTVSGAVTGDTGVGQYSAATDLFPRRISSDATRAKIRDFIRHAGRAAPAGGG